MDSRGLAQRIDSRPTRHSLEQSDRERPKASSPGARVAFACGVPRPRLVGGRRGRGPLDLRGARERAVLAYLLVHLGRSVSAEIVDAVWDDPQRASAVRSLQARISRLRRMLEPTRAAASASVVARDGAGYRLAVADGSVDAKRFEQLVAEARGAEPSDALARADAALSLVRGEPYSDFVYLDFAQPEIRRLAELELQARELRLSALLDLGREREALLDLEPSSSRTPLRESLARLLMVALYRSGRHVDGLAVYRGLVERLRELGLEPDEESRRLERQMLHHAPELAPIGARRTNIGDRLTSFVGREDDRAQVLARSPGIGS